MVIDALRAALAPRADVELALLFGSEARGSATPTSDVDVAVITEPSVDLLSLAHDLTCVLGREVQVVALRDAGIPLLEEVYRDAVLVHEGRPSAYGRWRAEALSMLETDRPWYARMRDAWLRRVAERGL